MIARRPLAAVTVLVAVACSFAIDAQQRSSEALRIVVIEGEGAVNIIQQKTAIAPLIEVRDRNDQPVAGATVNFVVRTGRATFGGARTLTVTTNAAGRAAAAGFSPSGAGALQVGATATFQGQAATAVTITQTTVTTAAEAAAVSSATASGAGSGGGSAAGGGGAGAGGGGGGISATTLGIVGGAVAAGAVAVAAKETIAGGATTFSGQLRGTMPDTLTRVIGGSFCSRHEQHTARVEIVLEQTEGSLSGTFEIDGTTATTPGTCGDVPDNYFGGGFNYGPAPISGTPDAVTMTLTTNEERTTPRGIHRVSYGFTFSGRLSGDSIAGTLTIVKNSTWSTGDPLQQETQYGTITYDLELRKEL